MGKMARRSGWYLFITVLLILSMTTTAFAGSIKDLDVVALDGGKAVTLEDMEVTITNDGINVEEKDEIDTSKEMKMRVEFSIPNDREDIKAGDYLEVELPKYLNFEVLTSTNIMMDVDGEKVLLGTMEVDANVATLTFAEAVASEDYLDKKGWFEATLSFDITKVDTEEDTIVIKILGKEFTIIVKPEVPEDLGTISIAKKGQASLTNGEVKWTVTLTPSLEDKTFDGYTFKDVMPSSPGSIEIIEDTFEINPTAVNKDNLKIDKDKGTIEYIFDKDVKGVQTITYTTKIKDIVANNNKTIKITNDASLIVGENVTKAAATVEVTPQLLAKNGKYNVADHSVNWTITVNSTGFKLNNAVVTDTLSEGMTVQSLKIGEKDVQKVEAGQEDETGKPYYTQVGNIVKIYLGDITGKVVIKLNTKLSGKLEQKVTNKASLNWGEGSGIGGGGEGVKVEADAETSITSGFVSKSVGTYDFNKNVLPWKVTINEAKQQITKAKLVEMFVYYDEPSNTTIKEVPSGVRANGGLDHAYWGGGVSFNQKYIKGSMEVNGDKVEPTVTEKKLESGITVQTVEYYLGDIDGKTYEITLNTEIKDKNVYGVNGRNTEYPSFYARAIANLYYGEDLSYGDQQKHMESAAQTTFKRHVLEKTLPEAKEGYFVGYDYENRSIVWKLHLNHNSIKINDGVITDTLPQYMNIDGTTDVGATGEQFYEIYKGVGDVKFTSNPVIATGEKLTDAEVKALLKSVEVKVNEKNSIETIKFKFNSFDEKYVIFVKTKVAEENVAKLFKGNDNVKVMNDAKLTGDSIVNQQGDYEEVVIKNSLASKTGMLETQKGADDKDYNTGNAIWTININSNSIELPADELDKVYVVDKLAKYLEPKMNGEDFAVRIWEMNLSQDGKLTTGDEVDQEIVQSGITYNDRSLRIQLPETNKAYRIELITRITDDTINELKNFVSIEGVTTEIVSKDESVKVEYAEGGAWAKLAGKIILSKISPDEAPLAGAVFELYDSEGTLMYKKTTDEDGQIRFTRLPAGEYKLVEVAAPFGYEISDRAKSIPVTVDPTSEEKEVAITVTNEKLSRGAQLLKTDELGNPLEGAEFALYKGEVADNNIIGKVFSNEAGTITFKDLEVGTYFIEEVNPPKGYLINPENNTIKIIVNKDGEVSYFGGEDFQTSMNGNPTIENKAFTGKIIISKVDEEGRPLVGATFTLYNEKGIAVGTAVSQGDNGIAEFENVRLGDYTVKETAAPTGYTLSDRTINVYESDFAKNLVELSFTVENQRTTDGGGGDNGGGNNGGGGGNNSGNNTDIPDGDVPLGDANVDAIIPEPEVPLGNKPGEVMVDLGEEDVPLAALPTTGGDGVAGFLGLGTMLLALGAFLRRRENQN